MTIEPYKRPLYVIDSDKGEILKALETISAQLYEVFNAYVKISERALGMMHENCPHKEEWNKQ